MKRILALVAILINFAAYSQVTKNAPYHFTNYISIDSTLSVGDHVSFDSSLSVGTTLDVDSFADIAGTLTVDSSLVLGDSILFDAGSPYVGSAGKYMKLDTLANGAYYLKADTLANPDFMEYDSLLSAPFEKVGNDWRSADTSTPARFAIGGEPTGISQLYIKGGVERSVEYLTNDITDLPVSTGDIFVTSANTGVTQFTTAAGLQEGRIIIVVGGSAINATTVQDDALFSLAGGLPFTFDLGFTMTFISVKLSGTIMLRELSRTE